MDLSKIISVSGRPGLYEIKTQTRTGVVAISLIDGKRITPNSNSQISILGDIKVYCIGKEIPLTKVFEKIISFESGAKTSVSPKATVLELEAYFFEILDNYDEEKVYASDIKKILKWYNLLLSKKLITLPKLKKTSTKKVKDKKNETPSEK
tara:strand:- start:1384 stop:1836 length:453 start_codon:yes stop_codon:yes gene_type:complete